MFSERYLSCKEVVLHLPFPSGVLYYTQVTPAHKNVGVVFIDFISV